MYNCLTYSIVWIPVCLIGYLPFFRISISKFDLWLWHPRFISFDRNHTFNSESALSTEHPLWLYPLHHRPDPTAKFLEASIAASLSPRPGTTTAGPGDRRKKRNKYAAFSKPTAGIIHDPTHITHPQLDVLSIFVFFYFTTLSSFYFFYSSMSSFFLFNFFSYQEVSCSKKMLWKHSHENIFEELFVKELWCFIHDADFSDLNGF